MVHTLAEDFAAEVAQLCAVQVNDPQWRHFLDSHVPMVDPATSRLLVGRALTMADRQRDRLEQLYRHDPRVAPWLAPPTECCRPSTPTTSTTASSAVTGPNATASRRSPVSSGSWTAPPGTPFSHCWRKLHDPYLARLLSSGMVGGLRTLLVVSGAGPTAKRKTVVLRLPASCPDASHLSPGAPDTAATAAGQSAQGAPDYELGCGTFTSGHFSLGLTPT